MTTIPSSSTSPTPGTRTLRFPEITALARFAPASAISFVFVHCGAVVSRQPAATSLSPPTPATTRQLEDLTAAGCLSSSGRIHYLDFDSQLLAAEVSTGFPSPSRSASATVPHCRMVLISAESTSVAPSRKREQDKHLPLSAQCSFPDHPSTADNLLTE